MNFRKYFAEISRARTKITKFRRSPKFFWVREKFFWVREKFLRCSAKFFAVARNFFRGTPIAAGFSRHTVLRRTSWAKLRSRNFLCASEISRIFSRDAREISKIFPGFAREIREIFDPIFHFAIQILPNSRAIPAPF